MVALVSNNHSYFIFGVDFASEICYNKNTESEVNKMKHTKLNFSNFIKLVEEGYIKVGRYEYERNVDKNGDSHYHRYYRKGDEIISEEVTPFK